MRLRTVLAGVASVVMTLKCASTLAQAYLTQDEAKYLGAVDRTVDAIAINQSRRNIAQMKAIMSAQAKLSYGYTVCEALDQGETMGDIRQATYASARNATKNFNEASNEVLYFSSLQVSAVENLCPQYEVQLDK